MFFSKFLYFTISFIIILVIFVVMLLSRVSRSASRTIIKRSYANLSYISDIHVDLMANVPRILPQTKYLAICGDVGNPTHPHVDAFFKQAKATHDQVVFVPGNHDYDCRAMYKSELVNQYKPILKELCAKYSIVMLDNAEHLLENKYLIVGSTLWCKPLTTERMYRALDQEEEKTNKLFQHLSQHYDAVEYLRTTIHNNSKNNKKKHIIVITHYLPTFQLVEKKYKSYGEYRTSWYATNVEHLITPAIQFWLCGHSHSKLVANINGVYCGINAFGYPHEHQSRNHSSLHNNNNNVVVPVVLPNRKTDC